MEKDKKKRAIVYSNINKKADFESAYSDNFDDEIIIGLANSSGPKKIKTKDIQKENRGVNKNTYLSKEQNKVNHNIKVDYINSDDIENNNKSKITIQEKIKIQKRKIIKKISALLIFFILIIATIVILFLSPIFNIKSIEVINNNTISSEQIIDISGISTNENIFKYSRREVEENIRLNPYIEDVKVSRNMFSDTVQIDVNERMATLMLEYGNSYVYINNQGYILEVSTVKINSPIIKGYVTPLEDIKPGNRLNKEDLERLEIVLKIMEVANSNEIESLITYLNINNPKDYIMVLESEAKTVYLGKCSDLATQMLYIKKMLEREKGIEGEFFVNMDLNTVNPVFRERV